MLLMYLCARGIDFASFYDFCIGFWKSSGSVKDRKHNGKKRTKGQTMIYITLHIKHDIIACSPEAQSEIPHFLKISKILTV
jgi:hypothetical protein